MDRSTGRLYRTRAALVLVGLVAVLSMATGIASITVGRFGGPLASVLPPAIQRTAGFTGVLTGFLMLTSALGLRRGLRAAWYSTMVLLPLTALQGLAQSSVFSVPLVVLSVLSLPTVLVNRGAFDRPVSLSAAQVAALLAIVAAQVYGTVGAYALREEFDGITTLLDAFYFTLVTASTVGYGDATPTSQVARLFGMSVILVGTASFAAALGTLLAPAIEARLKKALGTMTDTEFVVDDHVVVVGVSDMTEPIIEELAEEAVPVVVVTADPERATALRDAGHEVLAADPSDEEPLQRAGIERARSAVVATDDDAQDALTILTARELNPDLRIIAAATDRENVRKLRRAGADEVVSPAVIGGHLLVRSALGATDMGDLAEHLMAADDADAI